MRVVNQHRRLGADERGRRYLRRHQDVGAQELEEALRPGDEPEVWACNCDTCTYTLTPADLLLHDAAVSLAGFERSGFASLSPVLAPELIGAPSPIPGEHLAGAALARLRAVVSDGLEATIDADPESRRARSSLRLAVRAAPALRRWCIERPGAVGMLLTLAPFWIRSLDGWPPPSGGDDDAVGRALVEHLLVQYPVPVALYTPWREAPLPPFKWAVWLVILGQGGSLHDAARVFGWKIAHGLTGWLAQAPVELAVVEAVMWAELRRLGVGARDARRLLAHPAYLLDPTDGGAGPLVDPFDEDGAQLEPACSTAQRQFWVETAGWLARHGEGLSDADAAAVLEWAMHCHTEGARPGGAPFRWKGRTAASALAAARPYQRRIVAWRAWANGAPIEWARHRADWVHVEVDGRWAVRELCCGDELAEEAQALQHCVFGYAFRCAQGVSQIYSLTHDDERRLTIELDARDHVVQIRGRSNRAPTERERQIVSRWLRAEQAVALARSP